MAATIKESKKFKERVLNPQENYEQVLRDYLIAGEGCYTCAYDDKRNALKKGKPSDEFYIKDLNKKGLQRIGSIAVGIGFDMIENDDTEWKMAFSHLGDKMPNFEDVRDGKACLENYEQVYMLFRACIDVRRVKLKKTCSIQRAMGAYDS